MSSDKKTQGAWVIHHSQKLDLVYGSHDFDQLQESGKCGRLLAALSRDKQATIPKKNAQILAKSAGITKTEFEPLLATLTSLSLVDVSNEEVTVLGVSTESILRHTSQIYERSDPSKIEDAVIFLADRASQEPVLRREVAEELGDTYKLSTKDTLELLAISSQYGFIDSEDVGDSDALIFNGNIFRREGAAKSKKILDALSAQERSLVVQFTQDLSTEGCMTLEHGRTRLGQVLLDKLRSAGVIDVSTVSNPKESISFVTSPHAFHKYNRPFEDDILDLAKAFVAALTYGIQKSNHARGQIRFLEALLRKLLRDEEVGPVKAIGEDYQILERKGVVLVTDVGGDRYSMRLLKRDVGEMALAVLLGGGASEHSLLKPPQAAVTGFVAPEVNRSHFRKVQSVETKRGTLEILRTLRTRG